MYSWNKPNLVGMYYSFIYYYIGYANIWFKFFESKDHTKIKSAPLVPINDDSLLWVNAGVTPLKKYFDGSEVPNNRRMVNIQKCIEKDTKCVVFFNDKIYRGKYLNPSAIDANPIVKLD